MINLNEAVLAKARKAKSVEELLTLAKESGVEITAEQAQDIYAQLNQKSGELADDELDNVAGGGCYSGEGYLVVSGGVKCSLWVCSRCGGTEYGKVFAHGKSLEVCKNCGEGYCCRGCRYCFSQAGLVLCSNPGNKQ